MEGGAIKAVQISLREETCPHYAAGNFFRTVTHLRDRFGRIDGFA